MRRRGGPIVLSQADFGLDRPFLFCAAGDSGLALLVGVANPRRKSDREAGFPP